MSPALDPLQVLVPLTVGVFEVSDRYELVWKETEHNDLLYACVGKQGKHLKMAIALREIERLSNIHKFDYRVVAKKDGSVQVTIGEMKDVS